MALALPSISLYQKDKPVFPPPFTLFPQRTVPSALYKIARA